MTILEVTATTFGPGRTGGGERHPTEFARELARHEPVVAVAALPDGEPAPLTPFLRVPARFGALPSLLTRTNPLPTWVAPRVIARYLAEHAGEVEFVHVHNLRTAVSTLWLLLSQLRKRGDHFRILVTDHGARFFPAPRITARWVDYWIPVSTVSERQLLALAPHPSRVVPAAVSDRFLAREPAPFADRPVDLLFAGRLAPWKRPERVLELAAQLKDRLGRPVPTVIAGGVLAPEFLDYLRRRASELGLGPEVTFLPNPSDESLGSLYTRAKLYCFPSDAVDTFGRRHPYPELSSATILEAAAAGTPTLANRLPATEEQVREGVTGHVVGGFSSLEGVEIAASLLSDPQRWARLSDGAHAYVLAERTYPKIVERFRDFLEEIRRGAV